jgi:hypothetical protein
VRSRDAGAGGCRGRQCSVATGRVWAEAGSAKREGCSFGVNGDAVECRGLVWSWNAAAGASEGLSLQPIMFFWCGASSKLLHS